MTLLTGVLVLLALVVLPRPVRSGEIEGAAVDSTSQSPIPDSGVEVVSADEVAQSLDLLALALRSGASVPACLEAVAEVSSPTPRERLRSVAAALRWGVDPAVAWSEAPEIWAPAGRALALAEDAGVPPAPLLVEAAADVRRRAAEELDERLGRLSVLVMLPLGLCFLPAFGLLTVVPVVVGLARDVLGAGLA